MLTTKDFLISAKTKIMDHGWVQGHLGNRNEGYCLMGALDAVSDDLLDSGTSDSDTWKAYMKAERAVCNELKFQGMIAAVGSWNDAGHRTQQEVLDLLDSAARSAASE